VEKVMDQDLSPDEVRKNKAKFLLIVMLFVLPIGAALTMKLIGWRPQSTINHGTLIQPARPLVSVQLSAADGSKVSEKVFTEKWDLIVIAERACDATCEKNLYAIRQIHIAQGKNQHRVRRILLSGQSPSEFSRLTTQYPDLILLTGNSAALRAIQNWTRAGDEDRNILDGSRVFVVDPLGNLMMYYNPGSDPAGMRKDLARLLRVSHIG